MDATDPVTATARSRAYGFLALAFDYPEDGALRAALCEQAQQLEADLHALEDHESLNHASGVRSALETLAADGLRAEYVGCFGHTISKDCPPYEAEYSEAHIFQKSQTLADVAGFYHAFGLALAPDFRDRVDHVSAELEFMAFLCLKEAYALARDHSPEQLAVCREAQGGFLRQHLGRWVCVFARRLEHKAADGLYGRLGALLASFVARELQALGGQEPVQDAERLAPGTGPYRTSVLVEPPTVSKRGGSL